MLKNFPSVYLFFSTNLVSFNPELQLSLLSLDVSLLSRDCTDSLESELSIFFIVCSSYLLFFLFFENFIQLLLDEYVHSMFSVRPLTSFSISPQPIGFDLFN